MEDGEGGGGGVLRKKKLGTGEVDFKEKSGTAWSHSYLNQKPWHPLSYPNQRRKWIAEQTKAQHQRRADDVAREFAQEQEFFRQTALISKKEKEKVEIMKAVSFMYVRPPGYNAESAKAAEVEDEKKREDESYPQSSNDVAAASIMPAEEKKKSRPKDVFGRALPTGEEFEALKNAPRLETGVAGRAKPFGIEIRNVKCLRCENYGHQSGDRECPLKDTIMPNEEKRLKRDDPLTSIMAHVDSSEPLKWELKQKPGLSPPRGGFKPDDPNQQIVAEDDIFDEYGGFLNGPDIPDLLTNFSIMKKSKKSSKKKKTKKRQNSDSSDDSEVRNRRKHRHRSVSPDSEQDRKRSKNWHRSVSPDSERDRKRSKNRHRSLSRDSGRDRKRSKHRHCSVSPDDSYYDRHRNRIKAQCFDDAEKEKARKRSKRRLDSASPEEFEDRYRPSVSRNDSDYDKHRERHKHWHSDSSEDSEYERDHNRKKHRRHPHRH